jgi:TPP-dependent pyruvate/acetoin dehydrogenase alpha subunit
MYAPGIQYSMPLQELEKGPGYGIESSAVDGMDLMAVMDA